MFYSILIFSNPTTLGTRTYLSMTMYNTE